MPTIRLCCFGMFIFTLSSTGTTWAQVEIAHIRFNNRWSITTDNYKATVAADGCLTNLKIDGEEFFAPKVGISRGSYFFANNKPLAITGVIHKGNRLTAENSHVSIQYQFDNDHMTWTLMNKSDVPTVFVIVLAKEVTVCQDPRGSFYIAPTGAKHKWSRTTWYRGESQMSVSGNDTTWGPWSKNHQVIEVSLAKQEPRTLTIHPGKVSKNVKAKLKLAKTFKTKNKTPKTPAVEDKPGTKPGTNPPAPAPVPKPDPIRQKREAAAKRSLDLAMKIAAKDKIKGYFRLQNVAKQFRGTKAANVAAQMATELKEDPKTGRAIRQTINERDAVDLMKFAKQYIAAKQYDKAYDALTKITRNFRTTRVAAEAAKLRNEIRDKRKKSN